MIIGRVDEAKDDVVGGQIVVLVDNKKLAAVGVGAGVGHGDGAPGVIAGYGFVGKFIAGTTGAEAGRVTALDHKAFNDPVKRSVVIETLLT